MAALGLAMAVVLTWIVPAALGPLSVDCGELDAVTCERVWRQVEDETDDGGLAFLPVTRIRVSEMTTERLWCGDVEIEWFFGVFGVIATYHC
jgi:hypothetical protein